MRVMTFEEFSKICDLLNSPDTEVCELGRQMLSEFNTVKIFGYETHTAFWVLNKNKHYIAQVPKYKWNKEQLYKDITEC